MSQVPVFAASTMAATVSYATSSTDAPSRRPSSRARSIATPRDSPVLGSFRARMKLP